MLVAADRVLPLDGFMLQLEPPMGLQALGQELRLLFFAQGQGGAIIDRRTTCLERKLALELQFVTALPAGIKSSSRLQPFGRRLVLFETIRLACLLVPVQPEPALVFPDAVRISRRRALLIGVVHVQQVVALDLPRPQPVEQRDAGITDVKAPRRARSKPKLHLVLVWPGL